MEVSGGAELESESALASASASESPPGVATPSDRRPAVERALLRDKDEKIKQLETDFLTVSDKCEKNQSELTDAQKKMEELEKQLDLARSELSDARDSLKIHQNNSESFRLQRDSALLVQDSLSNMIETRNKEMNCMKQMIDESHIQLQKAFNVKSESLLKTKSLQNKSMCNYYMELHSESSKAGRVDQIEMLKGELNRCSADLQNVQGNLASLKVDFERQLARKNDELNVSNIKITKLNLVKDNLNSKVEMLNKKLNQFFEKESKTSEEFNNELISKTKIVEMYKNIQEDSNAKNEELTRAITELRQLLTESSDKYEELELNFKRSNLEHKEMIDIKNDSIASLKRELENANELLQLTDNESFSAAMEDLSPSAAIASRFIKSRMSLTQAYDQLIQLSEELTAEKGENKRLTHALNRIVNELEEKAPFIEQQKVQCEETAEMNSLLNQRLDSVVSEYNQLKEESAENTKLSTRYQKENAQLKIEVDDLSHQICFLLKEAEVRKGKYFSHDDSNISNSMINSNVGLNSSQIITSELVTFSDIKDLQANNQKLLKLVRNLSEKKEEKEQIKDQIDGEDFEAKLETLKNRIAELTEAQDRQVKMINELIRQRDTYKKMCNDQNLENSMKKCDESFDKTGADKFQCLEILESQLADMKKELHHEKEQHRLFVEKSKTNELKLVQMNDTAQKQLNELHSKYIKCLSTSNGLAEKCKVLQMNNREITVLTGKVNSYSHLMGKQETFNKKIHDELSISKSKLMQAESLINTLQTEHTKLINLSKKLQNESRNTSQDKQDYSFAVKNIESIKSSIENNDSDSVVKIQSTLEEANITYSTLRCMLQLEQSKYRDLTSYLKDEMEQYKHQIYSEQDVIEKLKAELTEAKEDLLSKATVIKDLNSQLSYKNKNDASYNPALGSAPSGERSDDVQVLKQQLEISRGHIEKYCNIYESSERDLKALNETFNEYKQKTEAQLEMSQKQEEDLRKKCESLEEKLAVSSIEVKSKQDMLSSMSQELTDKSSALDKALLDIKKLAESGQEAEEKYAYEIILHSNDIQSLTQIKEQLLKANQEIGEMERIKMELESVLKENKEAWENREKMLLQENGDVKDQLLDINKQNTILHDRIQSLSSKLTLAHTSKSLDNVGDVSIADNTLNYSLDEVESKSSEQLLQIIKYLRKEKDILMTKFEIMQVENQRIKSQLETTETQLDDAKLTSVDKNQSDIVSAKHSGVIRKVETLNAMSDCFVDLRKERDHLHAQVQEMSKKYTELSNSIVHLQENNNELSAKISLLQTENNNYRTEVVKWKNMANALIEKDDTTSTDDFKKLQTEREMLTKSLATEKDNIKKLSDEITKLTVEKSQYENQVDNLCKHQSILSDNLKKKINELTSVKRDFDKLNQDLSEARSVITEKTKEVIDLGVKSNADDAIIADIRSKEAQVRKIGKRYKTQYEELLKTVEEEKKKSAALVSEAATTSETHIETCKILEQKTIDLERNHADKLSDLKTQISSSTDENKTLQKEIDTLKQSSLEHTTMEEKARQLLKQAKAKIMIATEAKENLTKELNEAKAKLEVFEQNKDENDVRLSLLKSQYDGRAAKLEKERTQMLQEKQAEILQLNKQIELLMQKINQMQKKIDIHQSPKPSTSSNQGEKCSSEPPTANIKPMAGVSQRDTNRRVTGDTPLASIRPMASHSGVRTAAVLPTTAQPTTHSLIQAPHTTGSVTGDMLSSSSSLGIEYLPSSSSPGTRIHPQHARHVALPPPESTQDMDTDISVGGETSSVGGNVPLVPQSLSTSQLGSQAVALVMPRMETTAADAQALHPHQQQASSSSNNNSSSTVTTSHGPVSGNSGLVNKGELHRAFKRPRVLSAQPQKTILKRLKIQGFQRVTENDADYQMPTSSQRDQEDEMVGFGDSDDEENYQDPIYEVEDEENDIDDKERPATEARSVADLNIPEDQEATGSNNEVDLVDDSSQEVRSSHHEDVGSRRCDESLSGNFPTVSTIGNPIQEQQIETISSGTGVTSAATGGTYEEADDSIVPSTPTLYIPARNESESSNAATGAVADDAQADVAPQQMPHDPTLQGTPALSANIVVTPQSSEAEVGGSLSSRSNIIDDESPTVSSQSTPSSFVPQVEEGREAEASSTGSNNTAIRGSWRGSRSMHRRSMSPQIHHLAQRSTDQRPSPIVWNSDINMRRGFAPQRGSPRGGRHVMRRPPNFYKRF
ncbi:nucleoprotein TPR-like [Arctopsyche grandis]|uniref:nucleoprotein TPR-like n=1 Tax=Arctopsyche grandis TaxID=121162 RepID=UPI00406D6CC0